MESLYERIYFFSAEDISLGRNFEKALKLLDKFDPSKPNTDINDIIELYQIHLIFKYGRIKPAYTQPYSIKVRSIMPIISDFFLQICDSSLLTQYRLVYKTYHSSFWSLFDKFKLYDRISPSTFCGVLREDNSAIYDILKHKHLVSHYDQTLSEFLRNFDKTAEILIKKYLQKSSSNAGDSYFIPPSLAPHEFDTILNDYVQSEDPHMGLLQLLANSQSSAALPLSDELKLTAQKKTAQFWSKRSASGVMAKISCSACFTNSDVPVSWEHIPPFEYKFTYDSKWIEENLDYPTLLNNFIYLFNYTDLHFRCLFPSIISDISALESSIGVKGVKTYETGSAFHFKNLKSTMDMYAYTHFLSKRSICIEDVFKWFFSEYLKNEFNAIGFIFNGPTPNQFTLEKCRTLLSEMDGIFKQYNLFARNHAIDRELLEISSKPISFDSLPSMTKNKYAYANSTDIQKEIKFLFSNQTLLGYFPSQNRQYENFFEALSAQKVNLSDYPEWQIDSIRWLEKRSSIQIDATGMIHVNGRRVNILQDLYNHEVVCTSYAEKAEIEKLVACGDLKYGSSLFSVPEQHYLNYMLNQAEYSNGLDLRNKYIHSTYPLDEKQQQKDYLNLLKIMVVVIIKINEEFCLINPL